MRCAPLIVRTGSISGFDVSPDGNSIVFEEVGVDCLRLWRDGASDSPCVVMGAEPSGFRLSPDSNRLAFGRERRAERRMMGSGPHFRSGRTDLFVVDLPRDGR